MKQTFSTIITQETSADLEIRILARQDQGYPVEITFSGEQEFPRGYLKPDILPWIPGSSPTWDGERLFAALFADDELKKAWATVQGQSPQRRIRLRIDASAPELHALPWELLREVSPGVTARTLATHADTPFSRYLAGQWRPGRPILHRPIKLLVAIANPTDLAEYGLAELDVEAEKRLIEEAVSDVGADRNPYADRNPDDQLALTFLEQPVTLPALEAELKKGYHILHLVAHGRFGKRPEGADRNPIAHGGPQSTARSFGKEPEGADRDPEAPPVLFLADAENHIQRVSDAEFAEMLARQGACPEPDRGNALRLVFLASCQTATRSSADAFRGFAPRLIAAGIPAVLAMQDLVPIDTARGFASTFYRRLLEHGYVDLASNEARSALLSARLPGASIPVLFIRLRSGKLFGQRGQVLGERAESFWSILLDNIADGECTPFLGPGVTRKFLPSPGELAQTLARDHGYPFVRCDNLPRVAQFVGTFDNRRLRRDVVKTLITGFKKRVEGPVLSKVEGRLDPGDRSWGLSRTISASHWSEISGQLVENELHHQLADLGLPLYVTTNFDNFMTLALRARGRNARRETIPWRESLKRDAERPQYDLDPPATPEDPVVLHLFGTDDDLLSMVLTEDDLLDYLARISRDHEYLLPTSVNEALASTTLLFLGYRLEDLDFKVIMRGLLPNLDLERWGMLHVAVQIEATEVNEDMNQEVINYFQKYFGQSRIDVYWGSAHQFVADLHARWQEYHNG